MSLRTIILSVVGVLCIVLVYLIYTKPSSKPREGRFAAVVVLGLRTWVFTDTTVAQAVQNAINEWGCKPNFVWSDFGSNHALAVPESLWFEKPKEVDDE